MPISNISNRDTIEQPAAKDIMTPRVYMLPSTAKFKELIHLMYDKRISAVMIYDGITKEYFIISHTNVIDFLFKNQCLSDPTKLYETHLSELMKGPIDIVDESTPIDLVIRIMNNKGYKRVLVGKSGQPTGVVSTRDILSWNNEYFKSAKPLILLVMDNDTSIIIGKKVFKENFSESVNHELIELYGGALTSISAITDEILSHAGQMRVLRKDNYTIIFEPKDIITGILICDQNSIELRRRLKTFTERFCKEYASILNHSNYSSFAKSDLDLSKMGEIFIPSKL